MATTLGSAKLLRGQGMSTSWISTSNNPLLLPLNPLRSHNALHRLKSSPQIRLATPAPHFQEHQSDPRREAPRELPWQTIPEEPLPEPPQFGAPTLQRTPWDQSTPRFVSRNYTFNREPPQQQQAFQPPPTSSSGSHMLNIVEKLRAIEKKHLHLQRRSFGTTINAPPPSTTQAPGENPQGLVERSGGNFPWEKKGEAPQMVPLQPPKLPCLAELTIPDLELRRLQRIAIRVHNPIKVGCLGITKATVQEIHRRWQRCEIVKVKCDGPAAINMKNTHEELETKTGGLVIWRTGGMAIVYRGKSYFARVDNQHIDTLHKKYERRRRNLAEAMGTLERDVDRDYSQPEKEEEATPEPEAEKPQNLEQEYTNEIDAILDELGPRYDDWMGKKPVPVDGDLLPATIRGYRPPLRMLPFRAKPNVSDMELTVLRKLSKPLPPHFVVGRNRGLQGLAAGILKLWQKSEIVKIGVKRGVQHTRNQLMAEELEKLTGGLVVARDKFFIVLYRGKDFLPTSVAAVLREREASVRELLDREDRVRSFSMETDSIGLKPSVSGSLGESLQMKAEWDAKANEEDEEAQRNASIQALRVREQRRLEAKLATAISKKRRADLEIAKLEQSLQRSEYPQDREHLTEEERFMFRKLGLRMDAFLLIGRRGVFDGVIENMHLHWKHRELVKLILKEKDKEVAREVAKMLELESGGVLVAVSTTSKGQAIIVYRGKNYQRPPELRPRSLLTKRKALARSKELQRKAAIQRHINKLETLILKLRKDYDYLLKSDSLPEAPNTALYKEIDSEFKYNDVEKAGDEDDEDEVIYNSDLESEENRGESSESEEFEPLRGSEDEEEEDESEWDLESSDEDE